VNWAPALSPAGGNTQEILVAWSFIPVLPGTLKRKSNGWFEAAAA